MEQSERSFLQVIPTWLWWAAAGIILADGAALAWYLKPIYMGN